MSKKKDTQSNNLSFMYQNLSSDIFDLNAEVINDSAHVRVTWKLKPMFAASLPYLTERYGTLVMFLWGYCGDGSKQIRRVVPIEDGQCILQFTFSGDVGLFVCPVVPKHTRYLFLSNINAGVREFRTKLVPNWAFRSHTDEVKHPPSQEMFQDCLENFYSEYSMVDLEDIKNSGNTSLKFAAITSLKISPDGFAKEPPLFVKKLVHSGVPEWFLTSNSCDFNRLALMAPFYQIPLVLMNFVLAWLIRTINFVLLMVSSASLGIILKGLHLAAKDTSKLTLVINDPFIRVESAKFYAQGLVRSVDKKSGQAASLALMCLSPVVILVLIVLPIAGMYVDLPAISSVLRNVLLILPGIYLGQLIALLILFFKEKFSITRAIADWLEARKLEAERKRKLQLAALLEELRQREKLLPPIEDYTPELSSWKKFKIWFAELKAGVCLPFQS